MNEQQSDPRTPEEIAAERFLFDSLCKIFVGGADEKEFRWYWRFITSKLVKLMRV